MIISLFLAAVQARAPAAQPIEGLWKNPSGSVIMSIEPCGAALCGTVKWASAQAKADAAKGTNQLVGANLLTNLKPNGAAWTGRLFVPDEKIRASARIQLVDPQQLKVSGCAMLGAVCRSQLWIRTTDPLPVAE